MRRPLEVILRWLFLSIETLAAFSLLTIVAQRVSGANQFSVNPIKGLRVAYLCRIARHEAQRVPSIITGSRETARTASPQAGALSSLLPPLCARGGLLPAVLCVRRIPYRA